MIPNLVKSEIEKRRSQTELRRWVNELDSAFGVTKEGTRTARLMEGRLVKVFYNEVWPLALFADAFYANRTDVVFQPIIGNQSADALIINVGSSQVLNNLQITQSFDGYQNHLRMIHLEDHRWAPVTGPPLHKAPGSKHVPEMTLCTTDFHDGLEAELQLIRGAVERKSKMHYECKTSLIVEFEDEYIVRDRDTFDRFTKTQLVPLVSRFEALYLISNRGAKWCSQLQLNIS